MKPVAHWFRHAWLTLLVAGLLLVLDQWSKIWVRANLEKYVFYPIIGEWFGWQHVDNFGAAFGLFQRLGPLLLVFAPAVAIAILIYVRWVPTHKRLLLVLLGMQMAGALGNWIDRARQGFVTDFIRMGIPNVYIWPNYNVADISIVLGVIGLAIYIIVEDVRESREQKRVAAELRAAAPDSHTTVE